MTSALLAYAAQITFDPRTEQAVREVWRALAESGVAPFSQQSGERPHITLTVMRSLDLPEARRRLAELAARCPPLPVTFEIHGMFPGASPTTFLAPQNLTQLLELHAEACRLLDDLGELPEFNFYRPEHWIPHCTLAANCDAARLNEALEIGQRLKLPLHAEARAIALIEAYPVRHLSQWPLGQH